jgi:ATP-dependent RNA helicase DeaD
VSWTYEPEFDAAHRAALSNGKNLVYVCPAAGWAVLPLLRQLPATEGEGVETLLLAPETSEGLELAPMAASVEPLRPVHAVSGLARAGRIIKSHSVRTLVATPAEVLQLMSRSSLKLGAVARVVVLWPETHFELGAADAIDMILGECQGAQRLVVTSDEAPIADFTDRHARRAPIAAPARLPAKPAARVRYALVDRQRLGWAVRSALDALNPARALLWDPTPLAATRWAEYDGDPTVSVASDPGEDSFDLALAVELPSTDALDALRAVAQDVVVLARATQLPYLQGLAELSPLRLPSEADRARDKTAHMRSLVRSRLEAADCSGDLAALSPLFDEYDPALVAAAALQVSQKTAQDQSTAEPLPTWVHIRVNSGKRDRIRTADLVGALLNAVGLPKDNIGRVDVRDSFSLIEVRAEVAERTLRGLEGVSLRGRTVAAQIDRR